MDKPSRAILAQRANQQLEGAIACLDELECHQAAAHADMALNLLRADPRAVRPAAYRAEDAPGQL